MMDSVVGDDQTLPVDINGSCKLPDSIDGGDYSVDSMTAPSFPDTMSPIKALTMKDYENQITALKKENFNLKLRIYFMEERMQQKCDDSTEDIFKTNIELKVELESMKRDLAEKQELLVSASKALESLAVRESGEPQRVREQAQREMDALRDAHNKKIADMEQSLRMAEEEIKKMADIAEQEKLKNINMEKQFLALGMPSTLTPVPVPTLTHDLQQTLQEKDSIIEKLKSSLKNQEALFQQKNNADQGTDAPTRDHVRQLSALIVRKDEELQALQDELDREKVRTQRQLQGVTEKQSELGHLESTNKRLNEEVIHTKSTNENLTKALEDVRSQNKALSVKLEEKENGLNSEKKNALKRDKTIQGLTQVLKEKEKEISELCHEIEDRDQALTKAREAAHKAQLQRYQGAEEHQTLLMEKQAELAQLQGDHHTKVLEAQKLQRSLARKEQELADLQQAKDQLEAELEDSQQQKKKGDKALNDLQNQLKKLTGEIGDRESALEQQYQGLLDQTRRKIQAHEVTIQHLTSSLADKDQQLQEYINMVRDFELNRSPGGSDIMLSKLRERLKEKEKALEQALDEKFAAVEEKDNEIHQLQLSLREKERDLERLNNLLSHNEETINSFDSLIKEKDVELQHLSNTLKNLQRAKQDVEDNLSRSLREKDSIISQLQLSLQAKTKDLEEMSGAMLNQSQTQAHDLAEQMGQRLKMTEAMLTEAVKARERLVADNESAVEGLLATISSKDQLLKESSEHYNRMLSEYTREIRELKRQLCDRQQQLATAEKHSSTATQEGYLELAELKALLAEKDGLINLLEIGQERDQFLLDLRLKEEPEQVLELRQTIRILQEKLKEREDPEAELSRRNDEDNTENVVLTKKTVVILKKELAQKTEALNKALKRENELKISQTELESVLSELEARIKGHAASIESLTSTLETKDEIINDLHQRLGQKGDSQTCYSQDQASISRVDKLLPGLPQRERTIIGGDSQQEALPSLSALHEEHEALNRALRAEQQLYSSLVRTVKEQNSAQRLHALQLELTAVQLLRQQLEDGIKTNEELRDDLEKEIHKAQFKQDLVEPTELESMRHQLEDAQRWNASLQARLGAIQKRGGGVGGANDSGDTLSFIADQTSYMSICVGEVAEEGLSRLSEAELKQKVMELQECVSRLQALNGDLQKRLSVLERSENDPSGWSDPGLASDTPWKQQLEQMQEEQVSAHSSRTSHPAQDKECQTDIKLEQIVPGSQFDDVSTSSGRDQIGECSEVSHDTWDNKKRELLGRNKEGMTPKSLLVDCGTSSVSHHREELFSLRSENLELQGLLKEGNSTEFKERESADTSGDSSDGQADLRRTVEKLRAEAKSHHKVIRLLKEQLKMNSGEVLEGDIHVTSQLIVSTAQEREGQQTKSLSHIRSPRLHISRSTAAARSRLPVPVKLGTKAGSSRQLAQHSDHLETDASQQFHLQKVYRSSQNLPAESDYPKSPNRSTSPDSNHRYSHCSDTLAGSDNNPEARKRLNQTQTDSALFTQLELLHQECQEKEALINRLEEQLGEWEELQAQLQEKDQLNHRYLEALQAAKSTIAYLTACNWDSHGGLGSQPSLSAASSSMDLDAAFQMRCMELQKAVQEKEKLNSQFVEFLNMDEKALPSLSVSSTFSPTTEINDNNGFLDETSSERILGHPQGPNPELQQHAGSLQEVLWEQNRLSADLQEKLIGAATVGTQHGHNDASNGQDGNSNRQQIVGESLQMEGSGGQHGKLSCSDSMIVGQREITKSLTDCLNAAESAIASLTAHCTNTVSSGRPAQTSPDLQEHLARLQRLLQERDKLEDIGQIEPTQQTGRCPKNQSTAWAGTKGPLSHQLFHNLCLLHKTFSDCSQRISELQASLQKERDCRTGNKVQGRPQDVRGLPLDVEAQMETLQKALKDKKRSCKSLEEKLAAAQAIITLQNSSKKPFHGTAQKTPAVEQDDKCVQVDLQDLGYETSGKSENDREESSSTDLEVGVRPGVSASSLPFLLKQDQSTFSSTENLDSSSTSYPSSPALSSPKVSLKSLQAYEDYGSTEDPAQLQSQVRELKVQLESQTRGILQMQNLLCKSSLSCDLVNNTSDPMTRDQEGTMGEGCTQEGGYSHGELREKEDVENQQMKDQISNLNVELQRERTLNRSMTEQLQQAQHRSRSASPARLDSLVQSQARELSQLRQQIKESYGLGALQRHQLEELNRAFRELQQASNVDFGMDEVLKEQLDKSLSILEKLEGRLEKGDVHQNSEDGAALELVQSPGEPQQEMRYLFSNSESISDFPDSPARIQQEIDYLRLTLDVEREVQQQHLSFLVQQNQTLAECTREQLDLLSKELQEKNCLIQSLQSRLRGQNPSSHHSSYSDLSHSERVSISSHNSPTPRSGNLEAHAPETVVQQQVPPVGGVKVDGVSGHRDHASKVQGLQRENGRLQEKLRSSEELNATLRSELDLHRSIMAQTSSYHQEQDQGQDCAGEGPLVEDYKGEGHAASQQDTASLPRTVNTDLLAEHLQEIRALRQRLEESIGTNDRLREQLERRLAEVEKDPAATNIFIQGTEEQGQLASEVHFLWSQNQALKEQLSLGSRDKQKENEKLRETLARRTAKLEHCRKECEALRQENSNLQDRLECNHQEKTQLQNSLHYSRDELHRLQYEVKLQRQQLSDSQHLLQSLRVELQVHEKIKTQAHKHTESSEGVQEIVPGSGSVDLGELLSEIRHLRLQLERSIQTNTALRQRLEEQLLREPNRSDTININYLLSASDEGGRSPGREGYGPPRHSSHTHTEHTSALHEGKRRAQVEVDNVSQYSGSSGDSVSDAPSRLVPGHRLWANRNGRHVLGLIEDHNALRKQISEGRRLTRNMETQLQECLHTVKEQGSDNRVVEQQHVKTLSSSVNTMQQVLEEAARLLKLVWRVSLPAGSTAGEGSNNQQDELLKNEIARLRSRLSQQEKMLSGAVKRLRTTNRLKEGMERVIIDQLALTHGVLKKARGNLEEVPVNGQ
ncbi:CDK5 regulatory subunit-associated protein 2 isoform X3 [Lampris incognitus]|uniref:CDK5 regulatory subunit-associated protein 2 isoform X3 n=1 Tax=Lampris incognitus TaxID=2546036 RepID=UPI0024B4B8B4|nr:CDK5 regulatory subunit-associated protein 2 isoform X3 [Lampris incognitus]